MPVPSGADGRVERDPTERDIEMARRAVAEIARPAAVEAAEMDWAVAVAYTPQGRQELWAATTDGAPATFRRACTSRTLGDMM